MNGADNSSADNEKTDDLVVRKAEHGWVVGQEEVSDLTSAMVLADLFASEHNEEEEAPPVKAPPPQAPAQDADEAERLAVTVQQLEHALASRVQVEQAIGGLAERNKLRPRDAFDLLRGTARAQGRRLVDMAQDVVNSAANPLLRLPEELARKLPGGRPGRRAARRARRAEHQQAS